MKARAMLFTLLTSAAIAKIATAATEVSMHADMLGRLQAPSAHGDAPDLSLKITAETLFTGLPFDEAVEFFKSKKVMSPEELDALEDMYKAKGFSIAGVQSRYVLETAHEALSKALERGTAERETLDEIRAAFDSAGVGQLGDWQLRTVFDQAVLGSYAAGRYAQLTDPDVIAARPFWIYRTAGDSRVRPSHREMNGRVFRADDPVWQRWYPPNGWGCRCSVDSLSQSQIDREGHTVSDELPRMVQTADGQTVQMLPDPGFSGSPATQRTADRVVREIERQASATGVLGQSPADLDRVDDVARAARVDRYAGLSPDEVAKRLEQTFVFNVEPRGDAPPRDGWHVDWHMYSQNLDTAEQLATRLVQTDGLYALKDRVGVAARATYFGEWDPVRWADPEVVHDAELATRLGRAEGMTVARSTEYALRMRVESREELERVLDFLAANGERGEGKSPVRRAWEIQDVRIAAGEGVELPADQRGWRHAYRNVRELEGGRVQVTLSKQPLDGWDRAERVAVNQSLWEVL
jgi:SPP1 gp7 family putative phage head morphogenesis protein